jgi:hypothetical protein
MSRSWQVPGSDSSGYLYACTGDLRGVGSRYRWNPRRRDTQSSLPWSMTFSGVGFSADFFTRHANLEIVLELRGFLELSGSNTVRFILSAHFLLRSKGPHFSSSRTLSTFSDVGYS